MPSKLIQDNIFNIVQEHPNETTSGTSKQTPTKESSKENPNQVSWLSLFAELDPLANNPLDDNSGNRA